MGYLKVLYFCEVSGNFWTVAVQNAKGWHDIQQHHLTQLQLSVFIHF
jgi:hypothetical protein